MTYAEVERRANRLARYLRSRDVKRGDCVAMLLPRSLEVCVALLGILKSGAAYVPLDPGFPAERVGFILADCQARALVTTKSLATKAVNFPGEIIALDECQTEIASQPATRLSSAEIGATPEDLCYIIYTSGSTGQPKGVQIEHRSACHLVRCEGQIFQVRPEDRVYQGFSIAFDASVEEVWLAFFAGATLVVGNDEMVHAGAGAFPDASRCRRDGAFVRAHAAFDDGGRRAVGAAADSWRRAMPAGFGPALVAARAGALSTPTAPPRPPSSPPGRIVIPTNPSPLAGR